MRLSQRRHASPKLKFWTIACLDSGGKTVDTMHQTVARHFALGSDNTTRKAPPSVTVRINCRLVKERPSLKSGYGWLSLDDVSIGRDGRDIGIEFVRLLHIWPMRLRGILRQKTQPLGFTRLTVQLRYSMRATENLRVTTMHTQ